jgi:UDP-GlcNAc:undecaprenyl-phosphate GlcNAc-1-phosphate transferase
VALLPALALGSFALDLPPLPRVVVVVVGLVLLNVFNVIDGLDALAGGTAVLMLVSLTFSGTMPALAAVGIGATVGFLVFNLPPAKLFLGDEGSLLLGYVLWFLTAAWLAAIPPAQAMLSWSMVWLFPLVNFAYVVSVRLRARRPLLSGDRSHLYDDLKRKLGLTRTLIVCWVISALGAVCNAIVVPAS